MDVQRREDAMLDELSRCYARIQAQDDYIRELEHDEELEHA